MQDNAEAPLVLFLTGKQEQVTASPNAGMNNEVQSPPKSKPCVSRRSGERSLFTTALSLSLAAFPSTTIGKRNKVLASRMVVQ